MLGFILPLQCRVVMESPSFYSGFRCLSYYQHFSIFRRPSLWLVTATEGTLEQNAEMHAPQFPRSLPSPAPRLGILWVLRELGATPVPTSRGSAQRSAAALAVCVKALCVCQGTVCVSGRWWHLPAVFHQNWLPLVPISAAPWARSLDPSQS